MVTRHNRKELVWVKLLIGKNRGEVVEMPRHAAEASLSNGSVAEPTADELAFAKGDIVDVPSYVKTKIDSADPIDGRNDATGSGGSTERDDDDDDDA